MNGTGGPSAGPRFFDGVANGGYSTPLTTVGTTLVSVTTGSGLIQINGSWAVTAP
jgi:hypothetical protein